MLLETNVFGSWIRIQSNDFLFLVSVSSFSWQKCHSSFFFFFFNQQIFKSLYFLINIKKFSLQWKTKGIFLEKQRVFGFKTSRSFWEKLIYISIRYSMFVCWRHPLSVRLNLPVGSLTCICFVLCSVSGVLGNERKKTK